MPTNLRDKRELAARVLGVGIDRIRFDPNYLEDIGDAITRDDIRSLLTARTILIKPARGTSRGRARARHAKSKTRGRGQGSVKGRKKAREGKKELWTRRVRAMRKHIQMRRDRKEIDNKTFWSLYKKIKGGQVRSVAHLRELIGES